MELKFPSRRELANLPTPINKLSESIGKNIYMKRDDLTGVELSGNKIRKLEFYLAEAANKHADAIITTGGIQSNHCRATVFAARKMGILPVLVLAGSEPSQAEGNYFLNKLAGAKIFFSNSGDLHDVDKTIKEAEKWVKRQGLRAITIPLGASDELGMWGYILFVKELLEQIKSSGYDFKRIVCPVGSGGTIAGLLAGCAFFNLHVEVTGINILGTSSDLQQKVFSMLKKFEGRYGYNLDISRDDVNIIGGYVGEGYGKAWAELNDFIRYVAEKEGILLDPAYTGKALFGLKDLIEKGTIKDNETLFIHTGGAFGLFPHRNLTWNYSL